MKTGMSPSSSSGRTACSEIVRHEFVDSGRRRQRTVFADGTVVEADLDAGTFSVSRA